MLRNNMKMAGFIFGLLLLSSMNLYSNEISTATNYIPQNFDVLHYNLKMNLNDTINPRRVVACNSMIIRWNNPAQKDKFFFHLRDLSIDSVLLNGKKIEYATIGKPADIDYHHEISDFVSNTNQIDTVTVFYQGNMKQEYGGTWGGVNYLSNILFANGVGFNCNYVSTTCHWMPCYDHPSDKATFSAEFIVPFNYTVASNGLLSMGIMPDTSSDLKYIWNETSPCATYLLTFIKSKMIKMEFGNEELPITVYTQVNDTNSSKYAYKYVDKMVKCYSDRFGKYPFSKVGYANTPIGSMEHQGMICLDASIIKNAISAKDSLNSTIAHELSHQWFGNLVTPYDFRDAWLNESFATFCEAIWAEFNFGYSKYLDNIASFANNYLSKDYKSEGILPLYDFSRKSPSSNYPVTIYRKGAVVVAMLRYLMGDDKFFAAMKEYIETYKYSNVSYLQLKSVLEKHNGSSLDEFFNQWVIGKGWPKLSIEFKDDDPMPGTGNMYFFITQNQVASWGLFKNVPINFTYKTIFNEFKDTVIVLNDSVQFISIPDMKYDSNTKFNAGNSVRSLFQIDKITVTSIDDKQVSKEIKIYPIPAKDYIKINIDANQEESYNLKIYDDRATLIFEVKEYRNNQEIDINELSSGNYFISLQSEKIKYYGNFVVGK